jgi:hypothetical protein
LFTIFNERFLFCENIQDVVDVYKLLSKQRREKTVKAKKVSAYFFHAENLISHSWECSQPLKQERIEELV